MPGTSRARDHRHIEPPVETPDREHETPTGDASRPDWWGGERWGHHSGWHDEHRPGGYRTGRRRSPHWRRGLGPWRRSKDDRMLGGVAGALARQIGVDATIVRIVLVLFTLSGGIGGVAYVLAWLLVPMDGDEHNIASRALEDRRSIAIAAALVPLVILIVMTGSAMGANWVRSFLWTLVLSTAGLVLIWRHASPPEQDALHRILQPLAGLADTKGHRRLLWARLGIGVVLLGVGFHVLLRGNSGHEALSALGGLIVLVAAAVVVFGPWWLRLARDLVSERQARARAEERAELAARVHDSVLQTLALIQRRADQPQQVIQLARAQERELRSWLFGGAPPGSANRADTTLSAAVTRIQDEVESAHGITVDAVVVGDMALDESIRSLLAAAKEATVNAAKWSGAPSVSVFAEVRDESVWVFVRDRGEGFAVDEVPDHRKGITESIRGRMSRVGGTAEIRSEPGTGTEVALRLPLKVAGRT